MEITLNIKKASVYDDVAKLTGYVGAKTIEDTGLTYDRVFTTDDDKLMLEKFWREACNVASDEFKQFIVSVSSPQNSQTVDETEIFIVVMNMPGAYDVTLTPSVESTLFSFFVNTITCKWFAITNKGDVEFYKNESLSNANELKRKIYYRKKPFRIIPTD